MMLAIAIAWAATLATATEPASALSTGVRSAPTPVSDADRRDLLAAREAVWRAWFSNDTMSMQALLPEETIAINNGQEAWRNRAGIVADAAQFAAAGSKLLSLTFPRTEIQRYGDVAILYSQFKFEVETNGERGTASGRATEVFVKRGTRWLNPGWHLDSGK